ncbi:protein FAR1-RELATED SEQUENCE 1-like [Salvia miltiorrhiza]|uniref:protein FAR1-RELATED SEQUENCE 1-like n=1 Tax=Salvia miltiorrhiza TaxID=226208 RepID=UPI0025AD316D|nr:protein FAR1-RELATED SEQUENCE 1-like [Salvia miltiorrhiza]XP_057806584.1 protein FAR1-RELATED SEQUENCE 1-like [Salvia miltiorrhiza]
MLDKYALKENDWLKRLFNLKEKWALVYGRQMFCADMTTTQRSESVNSVVKRYVNYKHKFLEFFKHFQRLLDDRRYEEIKADFKASTSVPHLTYPVQILKQAAGIYTPEVYKIFEQEWYKAHDCSVECSDDGGLQVSYKITPYNKSHHHIVAFDSSSGKANCSCRKFEFAGILCSHILKVFTMKSITNIPGEYILKRWTRKAKVGFIGDSNLNTCNLDPKMLQNVRYKELCGLYVQLVTKASENEDTYRLVKDGILKMFDIVDDRLQSIKSTDNQVHGKEFDKHSVTEDELHTKEKNNSGAKGIKSKHKTTSGKRPRGGLEKASQKRRGRGGKILPSIAPTSSSPLLSSNFEGGEKNLNTTSVVSAIPYQRPNTFEEFYASSSQQSLGELSFPMNMTSLLLAQQPLNFGSLGTKNSQQNE